MRYLWSCVQTMARLCTAVPAMLLAVMLPAVADTRGAEPARWLVPAYGNPDTCCDGGEVMWQRLIALGRARPDELVVIFNPASGPGDPGQQVDGNYQDGSGGGPLPQLIDTGARVIGYVTSSRGAKSSAAVISEIQRYYSAAYWRGRRLQLDGIFLDEVSPDLRFAAGYRQIREALRQLRSDALLIGNPGQPRTVNPDGVATTPQQFAAAFDALVVSEGPADAYSSNYLRPSWATSASTTGMGSIVYAVADATQMQATLRRAVARGHRWIYVTDDLGANPYDYLSRYWNEQLAELRRLNANPPAFVVPSGISGNWMPQNQSGHGFQFEMIDPNTVTAFWFTFDNAGNEVWISGVGQIDGPRIRMPQAYRTRGGRFPPAFNPATVSRPAWGELQFTFESCERARVEWTTIDPAFSASGTLVLDKLTAVVGTSCE